MRIAIVAHNIVKKGNGQGEVTYALAKYLIAQGNELHLYANKIEPELKKDTVVHQIKIPQRPAIVKMPFFLIVATLKLFHKKYDIVYVNSCTYLGRYDFIVCWFCATEGMKYAVGFYHKIYTLIASWIERNEYYRKKGKIIAVSEREKNILMKALHIPEHKIKVVHDKINLPDFKIEKNSNNMKENKIKILYAGDLCYRKGVDFLITAMRGIDEDVTLLIAGKLKEKYRKLADGLQIKFLGFQSNMAHIFKKVDFLILPSLYDPSGVVVLEAMASGVPVIVSSRAGASELIKDMENGIILKDPTDVKEIREKILLLARNKELRQKIASQSIKSAKEICQFPSNFLEELCK